MPEAPSRATSRRICWLLLSQLDHPDAAFVIPTLAWMAEASGALFEQYLEAPRDGELFAKTGSTVLGGRHHEHFSYLARRFDVRIIELGIPAVFASSVITFDLPVLASGASASCVYRQLLAGRDLAPVEILRADLTETLGGQQFAPYLMPEIFFGRALGLRADALEPPQQAWLDGLGVPERTICVEPGDTHASFTLRMADRWRGKAKGVAFGDPDVILSQLAWHCRHRRLPLFGQRIDLPSHAVKASHYVEAHSVVADKAGELARSLGDPVIAGRQTGDADILKWSRYGCCIQITDPNRPPLPVIEEAPQPWADCDGLPAWTGPDDATLRQWVVEGRILATLIWHSGELAHNEAMLNVIELASVTGMCMGIGTHDVRYATCPQTWELLNVAIERGGAAGLIEPVLHSGGRGVLAESHCPPEALAEHCRIALENIARIAGRGGTPTGYYAFLDTDLATLTDVPHETHAAIAKTGLEYVISSARPGRNRVLGRHGDCLVLNQTPRVIQPASPFVRITSANDLKTVPAISPGWMIATLDAPVRAFAPNIWRHGHEVVELIDAMKARGWVPATPHTIARYARLLEQQ